MDFEPAARKALSPGHWGYLSGGVDGDATVRANLEGFKHFQLRPRRLVDIRETDLRTELFGTVWDTPIFLSPVGAQKTYNPDGEVAVARAAKAKKTLFVLANGTNCSLDEVTRALGAPPWFQLYMPGTWDDTEKIVRAVEAGGCTVLTWTIDGLGGRKGETQERLRRLDSSDCVACHTAVAREAPVHPMNLGQGSPRGATWDYVDRLKKLTRMKLLLKGIETAEDAKLCREHGVDGIIVSNHGGRAAETGRATIDCLAEVVDAAGSQTPVLVDGGFRRGTDVYKALALGARAVGIGRPYIYGLATFGQEGVEQVLDILRAELQVAMRQCGTPTIARITRASIVRSDRIL